MRVAFISDIHGNRQALDAVLESQAMEGADEIWCLGDITGYGADPDYCVQVVTDRCSVCLAGNHDLVISGQLSLAEFSFAAADAASWTMEILSKDHMAFIGGLNPSGSMDGLGLYHASPRDPVWEYVLSIPLANACMLEQKHRVCFIGHSHVACYFSRDGSGNATGSSAMNGQLLQLQSGNWLVNPGSVGQPRDNDPRASFLILDRDTMQCSFHRVEYPIDEAAKAILDAGLPESLAQRLYLGQ